MNQLQLKKSFEEIGSDVEFLAMKKRMWWETDSDRRPVTVNVENVNRKEHYVVHYDPEQNFQLTAIDVQPKDKHLLLMLKRPITNRLGQVIREEKSKLLCGHDERHYFSCAIPEEAGASTVLQAKQALLPPEFIKKQKKAGRAKNLLKRKNEVGLRQGEWLFIRGETFTPENPTMIKKQEPISRGRGSKPHICEEIYAIGGETVYVHEQYAPNGVSKAEMDKIVDELRKEVGPTQSIRIRFQVRTAGAKVYARGYVKHKDHATIHLNGWHEVMMNTESNAKASVYSVFLD